MQIRIVRLLVVFSLLPANVFAQQHARRGTVLGGVTGAIAGAAIGDNNDEAAAGALIGGAIGAITGAVVGDSVDQYERQTRVVQQQRYQQQARRVSALDVLTMKQNGLSDDIIINHIRRNGIREKLTVSDVIALHRQGLSDAVITAMQQASPAVYPARPTASYATPVIVEERHIVAPPVVRPYCPPPYYYYPPARHYHSSFGWGFQYGR